MYPGRLLTVGLLTGSAFYTWPLQYTGLKPEHTHKQLPRVEVSAPAVPLPEARVVRWGLSHTGVAAAPTPATHVSQPRFVQAIETPYPSHWTSRFGESSTGLVPQFTHRVQPRGVVTADVPTPEASVVRWGLAHTGATLAAGLQQATQHRIVTGFAPYPDSRILRWGQFRAAPPVPSVIVTQPRRAVGDAPLPGASVQRWGLLHAGGADFFGSYSPRQAYGDAPLPTARTLRWGFRTATVPVPSAVIVQGRLGQTVFVPLPEGRVLHYGLAHTGLVGPIAPSVPGLEYTPDTNRLHYTPDINRLHYTPDDEDA